MSQPRPPVGSLSGFFAFLAFGMGTLLVLLGAISFGSQLIFLPLGLALIVLAVGRREPPLAGALAGGSIAISLASWFSYRFGLSESIFQPNLVLLAGATAILCGSGYIVGRLLSRARFVVHLQR